MIFNLVPFAKPPLCIKDAFENLVGTVVMKQEKPKISIFCQNSKGLYLRFWCNFLNFSGYIQVILFEIDCAIFTQIYMNCFLSSKVEQTG